MSGPKVSSYELEQMRLAELRRQQEEELRRRMEEERRRRIQMDYQTMEKCKSDANKLNSEIKKLWQDLVTRCNVMQQPIDQTRINQVSCQILSFLEKYTDTTKLSQDSGNASECTQHFGAIRMQSNDFIRSIREENDRLDEINRQEARRELAIHMKKRADTTSTQRIDEVALREAADSLIKKISLELSTLSEDVPSSAIDGIEKIQQQFQIIQTSFRESAAQQTRMLQNLYEHDIARLVRNISEWRALSPLRQQCINMSSVLGIDFPSSVDEMSKSELMNELEQLNHRIAMKELQNECSELYKMLDVANPPTIQSLSKNELIQLREKLRELQLEQRSRAYIAQAVEETMREMGYNLAATKSGASTREYLYTVHDNTVLRVNCESNGNIAMSIGRGTMNADHILSVTERDALVHDMSVFCTKYEEIQERLRNKGVLLNRNLVLRPAEAKYARIIDLSEFGLTEKKTKPAPTHRGLSSKSGRKLMKHIGDEV